MCRSTPPPPSTNTRRRHRQTLAFQTHFHHTVFVYSLFISRMSSSPRFSDLIAPSTAHSQGECRKLAFEAIRVTSQDAAHPVKNINDVIVVPAVLASGWETPPFPDYPQDIDIQFYGGECRVRAVCSSASLSPSHLCASKRRIARRSTCSCTSSSCHPALKHTPDDARKGSSLTCPKQSGNFSDTCRLHRNPAAQRESSRSSE